MARAELGGGRRRRRSSGEAAVRAEMGRPEHTDARGGRGVAGEARWRRGDDGWRPAVEVERGAGARVLLGAK